MPDTAKGEVTLLLEDIRAGQPQASRRLFELVYTQLGGLAAALMQGERVDHSFQTTDLVHEAFLRLVASESLDAARNRASFFAIASRAMRQILVEHARKRNAAKRAGGYRRLPLDDVLDHFEKEHANVLDLDGALDELAALHERQSQIVTLRFFGGLTIDEVAEQLQVSTATVENDFRMARAFLRRRLAET
ncbi:MAG: ECF-type sigma factor [Gemmataceae bacterium]|nr:ECF-type sigma factor [Gemmataceae bacterium]